MNYFLNHNKWTPIAADVQYVVIYEATDEEFDQQSSATRKEQHVEFFSGKALKEAMKDAAWKFSTARIFEMKPVEMRETKRKVQRTVISYSVKAPSRRKPSGQ